MAGIPVFAGIARKIALPFIALSFVGWIVFVAGFGELVNEVKKFNPNYNPGDDVTTYPFWAASVFGPVAIILAVVHALLWRQLSGVVGSITVVFFMMYITAFSFGLVESGIDLRLNAEQKFEKLLFAGGFLTALGWTGVLALWPWYKVNPSHDGYPGV